MKNNIKVLLSCLVLTTLLSSCEDKKDVWKEKVNEITLNFPNGNLYLYGRSWGLGGNHEEIVVSPYKINKKEEIHKSKVYTFYSNAIYYKKEKNRLIISAVKSQTTIPNEFESTIEILLQELKTKDDIEEYVRNYQKYGFTKFSSINK